MRLLEGFGDRPVILKDFVKSQKHYWREACYIPSASDRKADERVMTRFLELQGPDLNAGLVFREFVAFECRPQEDSNGMPLTREYRVFALDGQPLIVCANGDADDERDVHPPIEKFGDIMRQVRSRFYTMDLARLVNGEWMVVELGDAQVAGLPETLKVSEFYTRLQAGLAHLQGLDP
jgi:hypothetical protein